MLHHRALGRDLDQLVVSVIDNRRPMLAVMRAMLAAIGTGRIETHESPAEALEAFALNTPDLVIAAATMEPIAGAELVRRMRHKDAGPLCAVPAMIASAHAKTGVVAEALRAGAHQVLVLPLSASTLYRRLDWLINDDRPFELLGDHYVVAGLEERLALSIPRPTYVAAPAKKPLAVGEGERAPGAGPYLMRAREARN
jgi:PleD family two-component response regulator